MNFIYELGCSGLDGFVVDRNWAVSQKQSGRICSTCEWIMPNQLFEIASVLVEDIPKRVHFSRISGCNGGVVVSNELVHWIGIGKLRAVAHFIPIICPNIPTCGYQFIVEKREIGCVRGSSQSKPKLCARCGRLLYWPAGAAYMLARYWDIKRELQIMDASLFLSRRLFEHVLQPRKISRLIATKIRLAEKAEDGYPTDFEAMRAAIRCAGKRRAKT